jgi:hypothetical protein
VTGPDGDVTGNYTAMMRERGWSFHDLADEFARQAEQPAMDGGAGPKYLERWARSEAAAADLRAAADERHRPDDAPPPVDPRREPPKRHATPPRPPRRG